MINENLIATSFRSTPGFGIVYHESNPWGGPAGECHRWPLAFVDKPMFAIHPSQNDFLPRLIRYALGCVLAVSIAPAIPVSGQTDSRPVSQPEIIDQLDSVSLNELLDLLDSPVFQQREQAMVALTARGRDSLGPMARRYISATPEAAWRIKKSLEEIGTSGDEATFLKAVGLLQLLVGNNSIELELQLERLKIEWIEKQSRLAIERLQSRGATIDNVGQLPARVASRTAQTTETPTERVRVPVLSTKDKLAAVEKIVTGSLESNRELVLGNRSAVKPKKLTEEERLLQAIEIQMGQRALRGQVIGSHRPGVTATFGRQWTGNKSDFRQLRNVDRLSQINFQKQFIDRSILETLSDLSSLQTIEFDNCRFSGPALATEGLPDFITGLRFRNQDIEVSTIDRISKLAVKSLVFDNCDFSVASMRKMLALGSISYLELSNQELTSADFERLEKLKTLSQLKLSGTRFPFSAYKRLTKRRPQLFIEFTTTAFLGVRSVQGLRDSCQISDVISDSGADQGGVKINDTILKVDGNLIEQFNDLRANIALHKPGDDIRLTIRREEETLELTVRLGNYADAPQQ